MVDLVEASALAAEKLFSDLTECECTDRFGVPLRLSGATFQERLDAVMWHVARWKNLPPDVKVKIEGLS